MELSANSFTTFDGGVKNLKGSSTTVQPGAGTLKSFTSGTSDNPLTFEATFGSGSGKFLGYFNSSNPKQSWDDYYNGQKEELNGLLAADRAVAGFTKDGLWDKNVSDGQAGWRALALGIGFTLPSANIRPLSIATASQKVINSPIGRGVGDFVKLFKPIDVFDVTKTLYRGTTGKEVGSTILFLTDDAAVAATYIKNGGQVMSYEMTQFALKSLEYSKELRFARGIHGPTGAVSTEFIFEGKELIEALNSIATPIK